MARALIVTGDRESGKTTLCMALAASSPRFVGIVSVPLLDAGVRVGFAARNLATGEEWVLGSVGVDLGGPRYGRFSFSSGGIARAVDCLRGILASPNAGTGAGKGAGKGAGTGAGKGAGTGAERGAEAAAGDASPGPVVVIDEIGPLELDRGEGLAPVLPLLAAAGDLLLVARPSLVDRIEALVPRHERAVLVVTPENRAALARIAAARFD